LDPGWVKNQDPGWVKNQDPDHNFWVEILKFFDADGTPGSGIRDGKNSDPGWKKLGSGINNPG
jgi:hypothetical protein